MDIIRKKACYHFFCPTCINPNKVGLKSHIALKATNSQGFIPCLGKTVLERPQRGQTDLPIILFWVISQPDMLKTYHSDYFNLKNVLLLYPWRKTIKLLLWPSGKISTLEEMKFSILDFLNKYEKICSFLRISLHLLRKF